MLWFAFGLPKGQSVAKDGTMHRTLLGLAYALSLLFPTLGATAQEAVPLDFSQAHWVWADGEASLGEMVGFRRTVDEMFADVRGCSHLTELLLSLPTAAVQTEATFRRDNEDSGEKPFQLDRCHALETSGEAVRNYYPKWYRQPGKL